MNTSRKRLYALRSCWTRQIHRFHSIGESEIIYRNSTIGIQESRVYPRHVTHITEKLSSSLCGGNNWKVDNWKKGWVVVDEENKTALVHFCSVRGDLFHSIRVTSESEWSCFECLLKLFAKKSHKEMEYRKSLTMEKQAGAASSRLHRLSEVLTESVTQGKRVRYTLPTSGGIIRRSYITEKVVSKPGVIALSNTNSRVLINTSEVDHFTLEHKKDKLQGVIYGAHGVPRLMIEAA